MFKIRNPSDENSPQVIISKNYLNEVKNAPESKISFPLYSIQVSVDTDVVVIYKKVDIETKAFLLERSGSVLPSAAGTHVTRIDVNKNLGKFASQMEKFWAYQKLLGDLVAGITEECKETFKLVIPECDGSIKSYP